MDTLINRVVKRSSWIDGTSGRFANMTQKGKLVQARFGYQCGSQSRPLGSGTATAQKPLEPPEVNNDKSPFLALKNLRY